MRHSSGIVLIAILSITALTVLDSCSSRCVDEVLLQTIEMNLEVNNENLGIILSAPHNTRDTIRSETAQFYNYPEFRRFGILHHPARPVSLIASAYAQDDCPEQFEYISRMDPEKSELRLNLIYDATALGLGLIDPGTDLMQIPEISDTYLQDIIDNTFLNGGAPTPLTLGKNFFQPINDQWVILYFTFEEIDGTVFTDSVFAYVDLEF